MFKRINKNLQHQQWLRRHRLHCLIESLQNSKRHFLQVQFFNSTYSNAKKEWWTIFSFDCSWNITYYLFFHLSIHKKTLKWKKNWIYFGLCEKRKFAAVVLCVVCVCRASMKITWSSSPLSRSGLHSLVQISVTFTNKSHNFATTCCPIIWQRRLANYTLASFLSTTTITGCFSWGVYLFKIIYIMKW